MMTMQNCRECDGSPSRIGGHIHTCGCSESQNERRAGVVSKLVWNELFDLLDDKMDIPTNLAGEIAGACGRQARKIMLAWGRS